MKCSRNLLVVSFLNYGLIECSTVTFTNFSEVKNFELFFMFIKIRYSDWLLE